MSPGVGTILSEFTSTRCSEKRELSAVVNHRSHLLTVATRVLAVQADEPIGDTGVLWSGSGTIGLV